MAVKIAGRSAKELREERAKILIGEQKRHAERGDDWDAADEQRWQEAMADCERLHEAAGRMESIEGLISGSAFDESGNHQGGSAAADQDPMERLSGKGKDREQATVAIRVGSDARGRPNYVQLPAGNRGSAAYREAFADFLAMGEKSNKLAALQSDDQEQAGYLLASEQFAAGILKEVDDLLFVRQHARIHTVREANTLGIRARTARADTFDWSAELSVSDEDTSLKYGKRVLTPHHLTGQILVSRDLLRRSVVPVESEVTMELARDAGEKMEDGYLMGNGDRQPLGVFTPSTDGISTGRDVLTGSATDFLSNQLLAAKYALKSQYRMGQRGQVRWLFHRDAIAKIAKLRESTDGQYLLRVGMGVAQDGGPPEDNLLGFPVDESERAPNTFTDGNYVGLLANWNYYEIADALDMEMQVLFELFARTNQVGYIARLKTDGMPTLEEAFVRLKTGTL